MRLFDYNPYKDAINHYGADTQTAKAVEELAELQQALCKYLCSRSDSVRENIIEEIADVEIMLQQIKIIFNVNQNDVEKVKDFKLSRLAERIVADVSDATAEKIAGFANIFDGGATNENNATH